MINAILANLVIFFHIRKKDRVCLLGEGPYSPFRYIFHAIHLLAIIILQTKALVMNQANVKVSFYLKKSEADAVSYTHLDVYKRQYLDYPYLISDNVIVKLPSAK